MSVELKPCPFCGSRAERIDFGPDDAENAGGSCIACSHCGSSGPVEFGRKENFVSNWNRRTQPPTAGVDVSEAAIFRAADALCGKWKSYYPWNLHYPDAVSMAKTALTAAALRTGGGA